MADTTGPEESEERTPRGAVDRSEGFGERLLGTMIERTHEMPPPLIAPLVAEVISSIGGSEVSVLLQDYDQLTLVPLRGRGLVVEDPRPIDDSVAGKAFLTDTMCEQAVDKGVRLYIPMLDGTDRIGVLAFTVDRPDADDRRLATRFAGLLAETVVTKGMYSDLFFQTRRQQPMSMSAEMQWCQLPPLTMTTPQVAVAGILEPAYHVGGDSFDYALNADELHLAVIDAMGHGMDAAIMAAVTVAAYRYARRQETSLLDMYAIMSQAITDQFTPDQFVTAQMGRLNTTTGHLQWVNAGHPLPLLIRDGQVVGELSAPTTLPLGITGSTAQVGDEDLERGDRVLFFTDGIIEEKCKNGEQFGQDRLRESILQAEQLGGSVQQTVRRLSHALMRRRGGKTSDDSTLFLLEWTGASASHLTTLDP